MTASDRKAPIRLGIIGVGQIGKHHIRSYQTIDGAAIVAVCDINETEARRVAAEFGIADVYTDFHDLLARSDIQAVDLCLHNNLHMPATGRQARVLREADGGRLC